MNKNDIFEIMPDEYITYSIRPDYEIKNSDNISIANAIAYMYEPISRRININLKSTQIRFSKQIYFTIEFKKKSAVFYISIPVSHNDLLYSKIRNVWKGAEIKREEIKRIDKAAIGEMVLSDYAFKSLECSTKNLYPLTNMIGIINTLNDKESARVTIAIQPIGRHNWQSIGYEQYEKYKECELKPLNRDVKEKIVDVSMGVIEKGLDLYIDVQMFLIDSIMGLVTGSESDYEKDNKKYVVINGDEKRRHKDKNIKVIQPRDVERLSEYTKYKLKANAFKTKIYITASGPSGARNNINVMNIANAFHDLQGDNDLVLNMLDKKVAEKAIKSINDKLIFQDKKCILCDREIAKLIQLPQKDLQKQYNLNSIDTREVDIPAALKGGKVRIGEASKRGDKVIATFSENVNIMALPKVIIGPQNAGKTTTLKRIVKDCYKAGQSNLVIDVLEDCEVAKEVSGVVEEKDRVIIRIGSKEDIPALAYTEVSKLIKEDMNVWDRVQLASLIAEQVEYLINSIITLNTNDLTAPMQRYLHSACMVTFIKPGATIGDLFKVLRNHKIRAEAVSYAKHSRCYRLEDEIFSDMDEIDKKNAKKEIVGTREDLIIGITNRITALQKNPYVKEMLNVVPKDDDDFTKYIEQGKSIFVMIPQNEFPNPNTRDILATFFVTRIWLTAQLRKDNKNARICNIVFDEVGTIENTCKFLANHITEFRRHRLGSIFTCHYLNQFRGLLPALKGSGASYIILAGTEKENLEALKEEMKPFSVEEGLNLKEHTSINIINYGSQYAKFIARQMK